MLLSTLFFCFGLFRYSLAAYTLQDDYSGSNFLSGFTFFTDADPTEGYVDYVDGQSSGLFSQSGGEVKLSVDSSNVASGRGRQSLRLTSKASYNHALIVIDVGHMPADICGVWPAFWTTGPNWPSSGEIDIIEGVNTQSTNKMTLHTDPGCSMNGKDCQGSQGCSIDAGTYGASINSGGAVYALEWTSDGMSIWSWSGGAAPSDATGDSPDTSGWGDPTGSFPSGSSCEVDTFFKDQQIVFDTTFCGVWAGDVWADDSKCSGLAATCEDYVRDNPSAFEDAYWTINSLKVYTNGDGSSSSGSTGGSGSGSGETGGNSVSAGSAPASTAAPNPGPVNSAAPNPGPVNSAPANSAAPVNTGGVSVPATTAAQPVGNPAPTGAPGGGWPGRGGGGRPGRGGPPKKIKRRVRGRHMKHLIVEASDQRYDEQGQSVILEAGVPELGEELQRV